METVITMHDERKIENLEDKIQLLCDIANEHCLSIKDVQYNAEITIKNREDKILGYIYPIEIENLEDKVAEKFIDDPYGVIVIGLSEYIPISKVTEEDISFSKYVLDLWKRLSKYIKDNSIESNSAVNIICSFNSFKDLENYLKK